jgi:hypothetical protein
MLEIQATYNTFSYWTGQVTKVRDLKIAYTLQKLLLIQRKL